MIVTNIKVNEKTLQTNIAVNDPCETRPVLSNPLCPQTSLIGSRSACSPWAPLIAARQLVEKLTKWPAVSKRLDSTGLDCVRPTQFNVIRIIHRKVNLNF